MSPLRANAVALMAALAWGLGNVSQKTVLDHLDPFFATGMSCLLGALVLLPLARREMQANAKRSRPSWASVLSIAVMFSAAATSMQIGYGYTSVTNAGFLANTSPVITPVLAWVIHRQRPPLAVFPASLCVGAGVFFMAGGTWATPGTGDLLCLVAAAVFALWTVKLGDHVSVYRDPWTSTVQQLVICGISCLGLSALIHGWPAIEALQEAWPELLMIGVVSKGLAYGLNAIAQQHIHPTCASVLMSAEAVFGATCAMIFIGEILSSQQVIGAVLIITAIIIASCLPEPVTVVRIES